MFFMFLCSLFSVTMYVQDILQDVLVAFTSFSSTAKYQILSNLEVEEKNFGLAMIAIFCCSVIIIGIDTCVMMNKLALMKKHGKMLLMITLLACSVNLGPIVLTFTQFIIRTKYAKRLYQKEADRRRDEKLLELAQSSVKIKEALCENLPMLVIVCFKMALSTRVSLLEIASSASSACFFSKAVVKYAMHRRCVESRGFLKMLLSSLILSLFTYCTLILVTTFAIESERDGILVRNDPTSGIEESSGLVFVLLLLPTVFFCLLPFSIYDLVPCFLGDSPMIMKYFLDHPKPTWYLSVALQILALYFNLSMALYFFQRDPSSLFDFLPLYFVGSGCDGQIMGMELPKVICGQWDLKVGGGRIYFKGFLVVTMIISSIVFLISVFYTIGMSYRERIQFRKGYAQAIEEEIASLCESVANDKLKAFLCEYMTLSEAQTHAISEWTKNNTGVS